MKTPFLVPLLMFFVVRLLSAASGQDMKDFSDLGCQGAYDKNKFAYLYKICDECYKLLIEEEVLTLCRSNCFKNHNFRQCVDALVLQDDQQLLDNFIEELHGRRK